MSRTKNTIINVIMNCSARVMHIISNFVIRTIFIYSLGAEYNGVASLFTDFLMMLSFAELGISSAITYALYKPLYEKNYKRISQLMRFYKNAYYIVAISISVIGLALIPFLDYIITGVPEIKENIVLLYILYLINTVVSYLYIYKATFLIALQKKYMITKIEMIVIVVRTIMQCLFLVLTKEFVVYLIIQLAATFAQNYTISKRVDKQYPDLEKYEGKMEANDKKALMKDIKALSMYKIAGAIFGGIDSIIISITAGTIFVGYVANYKLIIKGVDGILNQFFIAIEPSVGNLATATNERKQYEIFQLMQFISFWIACFCSAVFITMLNPFVSIWIGDQHLLEMHVISIMIVDFYMVMMVRPIISFRTGNGLFVQGQYRPVIMAILNVALSIVLGICYGMFGVLLATVLSRMATLFWYEPYLVFSRVFNIPLLSYWKEYAYMLIVLIVVCGVTYRIVGMISIDKVILDFIVKFLASCMISNLCIILGMGWKQECKKVWRLLMKNRKMFQSM